MIVLVRGLWYRRLGDRQVVDQFDVKGEGAGLDEVGVPAEGTVDHVDQLTSELADLLRRTDLIKSCLCGPLRGQSCGAPPGSRPFVENRYPDLPEGPLAI